MIRPTTVAMMLWASAIAQSAVTVTKTEFRATATKISPAPPVGGNFCRTLTLRYRDGRIELR